MKTHIFSAEKYEKYQYFLVKRKNILSGAMEHTKTMFYLLLRTNK